MDEEDSNSIKQPCCEAWAKAQQDHTDNEGVGRLIDYNEDDEPEAGPGAGDMELPPFRFCPWCGAPKSKGG